MLQKTPDIYTGSTCLLLIETFLSQYELPDLKSLHKQNRALPLESLRDNALSLFK